MFTGMSIRRDENGRFTDKTPQEHEEQRKRRNARRRQLYHKSHPNAPYRDMSGKGKTVKKSVSKTVKKSVSKTVKKSVKPAVKKSGTIIVNKSRFTNFKPKMIDHKTFIFKWSYRLKNDIRIKEATLKELSETMEIQLRHQTDPNLRNAYREVPINTSGWKTKPNYPDVKEKVIAEHGLIECWIERKECKIKLPRNVKYYYDGKVYNRLADVTAAIDDKYRGSDRFFKPSYIRDNEWETDGKSNPTFRYTNYRVTVYAFKS